jgi:acetyltransferase-like isoleucine patch superfamily enzyme
MRLASDTLGNGRAAAHVRRLQGDGTMEFKYKALEPTPEAKRIFTEWLQQLDEFFAREKDVTARSEKVRDELHQLFFGRSRDANSAAAAPAHVAELCFNPQNITLEPEYYGDCDQQRYAVVKPLLYFWLMFDRSPAAINHWLGFRFRAMLGKHIFKSIGKRVKMFHGIEFSFGYNLTIEDDCVIHKYVLLDDRGELIIKQGTSISDYANVYTHTHDIHIQADITRRPTVLGPGARITYHATVLAGSDVGENAMLGAFGLATRAVPPHVVSAGIPAKIIKKKDPSKRDPAATPHPGED